MQTDNIAEKIIQQNEIQQNELRQNDIQQYLEQISETEGEMIEIAKTTLGSSFNIYRSLGFIAWKNKK